MTLQVKIRTVEEQDFESVVSIQEAIIQKNISASWMNLAKLQFAKPESVRLAAVLDDVVIGFLFGDVKHGHFGLEHSGWIEMFGVSPKVMGKSVGRTLAKAAKDRFRELGVTELYTAVQWDHGDILAFFKSIGFKPSDFIVLKSSLD